MKLVSFQEKDLSIPKSEQKFLGMSAEEAREFQLNTATFDMFRNFLFSRVIPNLSRIGF
jgi:hypothetical protein